MMYVYTNRSEQTSGCYASVADVIAAANRDGLRFCMVVGGAAIWYENLESYRTAQKTAWRGVSFQVQADLEFDAYETFAKDGESREEFAAWLADRDEAPPADNTAQDQAEQDADVVSQEVLRDEFGREIVVIRPEIRETADGNTRDTQILDAFGCPIIEIDPPAAPLEGDVRYHDTPADQHPAKVSPNGRAKKTPRSRKAKPQGVKGVATRKAKKVSYTQLQMLDAILRLGGCSVAELVEAIPFMNRVHFTQHYRAVRLLVANGWVVKQQEDGVDRLYISNEGQTLLLS